MKLVPIGSVTREPSGLNKLVIRNTFARNIISHFLTNQETGVNRTGVRSNSYFEAYRGLRIASIRLVRLHPFGTSLQDTVYHEANWTEKAGNYLHMNTSRKKLFMQLQFKVGESVNPVLMAENEKLLRDLNYIEDVNIRIDPQEKNREEVDVTVICKDKFEYGMNINVDADNSNVEVVNENMFGLGHRLGIGTAQKNKYLPEMGFYFSYHVNNLLGKFINTSIGMTDTYQKKGWNFGVERQFLTSREENAGGFSYDHVSRYNYIAEDHPIMLDTVVSYTACDAWYSRAIGSRSPAGLKTIISGRYYRQEFSRAGNDRAGNSRFLRDHDFLLTSLYFSRRNLYRHNLVYGYGVTEDIPYGLYAGFNLGVDRSPFGTLPYAGMSFNVARIGREGNYISGKIAFDGFLDDGTVRQGTILLGGNYFSRKYFINGDAVRHFARIEFMGGINRFPEEYLIIDSRSGIRDFHAPGLKGNSRIKVNLETVRYLKWRFYGFRFTSYIFTDFAFLADKPESILKQNFYAGLGTGFRIFNESLVFKIIDVRLTWFPHLPPQGMNPVGANMQGLTKSRFDDFLGQKPELIRYQ